MSYTPTNWQDGSAGGTPINAVRLNNIETGVDNTDAAIAAIDAQTGILKANGTTVVTATAGTDYIAPGGALGTPSSGNLANCTFPTLNQNTTGSAAKLTTPRTLQTNLASTATASFDGTANATPGVTGTLPVGNGGTGATTLTGLVKGNGTSAMTAAVAGTDFQSAIIVNVKDFGVKGDGTTDDTTAINSCISGSAAGSTIFFPPGTYLISAPIVLYPSRSYVGAGHSHANTTIIKQKNSANVTNAANLTGLLVAQAWSTNSTSCDLPVRIENLCIDGNKTNNASSTACGIVLTNYRSWIVDCDILNAPKDGIRLTDTTANGTTTVSNTCVENRIMNCHIDSPGLDGVRNVAGNGNSNTDGYLLNCIISNVGGSGINLDRAAGWHIRDNHLYTIPVHGINANAAYGTFITNNYVEDFGGQSTAASYYAGIAVTQLTGRQSTVTGNYVGCNETSASVGGYQYVSVSSAFGSSDSHVVVTGNMTHAPASPTNKGIAFVYAAAGGGSTSIIYDDNNDVDGVNSALFNDGSATVRSANLANATGTLTVGHGGTGATTLTGLVVGNGTSAMTAVAAPTGTVVGTSDTQTLTNKVITPRVTSLASSATPAVNINNWDMVEILSLATAITSMSSGLTGTPYDGQQIRWRFRDNGTARAITWGASFVSSGTATLLATTSANKIHNVVTMYDSTKAAHVCISVDATGY